MGYSVWFNRFGLNEVHEGVFNLQLIKLGLNVVLQWGTGSGFGCSLLV
jgi:hypothetical protein